MSPTIAQLVIFALQELLTHAPGMATEIQAILAKTDVTNEDWEALRAKVGSKSYHDYVPDSSLPPEPPATPLSP